MFSWLWCCIHCGRRQALCCVKASRVNALDIHILFIFVIHYIFAIFYIAVQILHIVYINWHFYIFPARIDDGCDADNWHYEDYRAGNSAPLRADRWYQQAPDSEPKSTSGDFAGIRINIWNRARVRRFLIDSLAGGDSHNLGYHAFIWETILHGNAGEFGKYTILKYLPDKIARFLYEFHDTDYVSLDLPPLELDRSDTNVHGVLKPHQVDNLIKYV